MFGYVYKTVNRVNGKSYIGKKQSSRFLGEEYLGSGLYLNNAIEKYGRENFNVELIESIEDGKESLSAREKYWISFYDAVKSDEFYNLAPGGEGWSPVFSDSHKANISRFHADVSGEKNPMYGKTHTEKARRIISESTSKRQLESKLSEEHKLKIGLGNRGKSRGAGVKKSEEFKAYLSKINLGRKHSELSKDKIRLSRSERKWITNGESTMSVKTDLLDQYLKAGWFLGRVLEKKPRRKKSNEAI